MSEDHTPRGPSKEPTVLLPTERISWGSAYYLDLKSRAKKQQTKKRQAERRWAEPIACCLHDPWSNKIMPGGRSQQQSWLAPVFLQYLTPGGVSHGERGARFFFSSLAERAITAVPVTALQKEAIVTSSAMPRIHQAETKQTKEDKTKSNQAKPTTQHQPNTNQSQTPEWKQSSLFLYNIQLKWDVKRRTT